jgi:RNA polymerase sigma factor
MDINERAALAATSEEEFESLLNEYRPFVASCAGKATGRHVDGHDDEMSVAVIAFSEAVRRFRPESGQFLSFAAGVIRSRLIDYYRGGTQKVESVSLDAYAEEGNRADAVQYRLAEQPKSRFEDPLKLEIDALSAELGRYGFSFMDVAKCSPKSDKTKRACRAAAKCLLGSPALLDSLRKARLLPVKKLEKGAGVSRKTIARHRNYIVCLAEILSGDYAYLAEYVKFDDGSDKR